MSRSKGDRAEREVKNLLQDLDYLAHKKVNNRFDNGDIWELFDVLAVKPSQKPKFIQVKSGSTQGWLKQFKEMADHFPNCVEVECWVRYDRKGYRILRFNWSEQSFTTVIDGRDKKKIGETVEELYDSSQNS